MQRSRILIADDHTLIAELCKRLLEPEFEVVDTVINGRAMVRVATQVKPDVIVLDIAMPVLNGLDAGRQVKAALPSVELVFLTMYTDPELALEAFDRGAAGYLLKTCAVTDLLTAVREVLRGKNYLSPSLEKAVASLRREQKKVANEEEPLTERQREVLQLLAEGKVMKEVAEVLNMTTRTVGWHKYRIMDTLGVDSDAALVRYAVRNHLIAA
jgi:DNA-binding NarL/FixJ family response regulator